MTTMDHDVYRYRFIKIKYIRITLVMTTMDHDVYRYRFIKIKYIKITFIL